MSPSRKRKVVVAVQREFGISERRACTVFGQARSSQRYVAKPRSDEAPLARRMLRLAWQNPRFGYRRICRLLQREAWRASESRIYRLWRREGLKVPQKRKKRVQLGTSDNGCLKHRAEHKDHVWSWDFIFDRTESGSQLKWLSIIDEHTRENLALKVDRRITSEDVIDTLAELFAMRGVPRCIRSDNGPEFIANALQRWLERVGVSALYIAPGSPWENGYAESFYSRFRDEFLAMESFENVSSTRSLTNEWRESYNNWRPHSSLGYLTPTEYSARCTASVSATPALQQPSGIT